MDDAIEKNEEIIAKIYCFLNNKYLQLIHNIELVPIGDLDYYEIIKSGINHFGENKVYIDTSAVSNDNIVDVSYKITFEDRPSRANMQPIKNSIWFAKLKDSPKFIIIKEKSKEILKNYILSTGFMGLQSDEYAINYLYLLILSEAFNKQKDASSTGATMMGINNDIFSSIKVPNISKSEAQEFGKSINNYIEKIIDLQNKNRIYGKLKQNLLSKYFD